MTRFILSILFAALVSGCVSRPPENPGSSPHEHVHRAPHGGRLVEVGEEFAHLELLWEADKALLTVYVLDGECEASVRLRQAELELRGKGWNGTLKAIASPLSDEKVGDTSHFAGSVPGLRGRSKWDGEIQVLTVNGQKFEHLPVAFP